MPARTTLAGTIAAALAVATGTRTRASPAHDADARDVGEHGVGEHGVGRW
ncbi:hypothetical protein [Actinoallomurus bryophytorum]|nr:hypothetical protein [Actinoallomurus bryophytorum]